jgi:hypothetical protein
MRFFCVNFLLAIHFLSCGCLAQSEHPSGPNNALVVDKFQIASKVLAEAKNYYGDSVGMSCAPVPYGEESEIYVDLLKRFTSSDIADVIYINDYRINIMFKSVSVSGKSVSMVLDMKLNNGQCGSFWFSELFN